MLTINHVVKYRDDDLDATFGALADPTRRAILARLAQSDSAVGALAEPFAMSLPAITKHLNVLERAGLITRSRDGRMRRCRLEPARMAEAADWVREIGAFWEIGLARLDLHLRKASDKPEKGKPRKKRRPT